MKIAYLILAHSQPILFKRLLKSLEYKDDCFFVHIDLKTDISQFKDSDLKNIFFLSKRIKVNHAAFSQVWAMISLIKAALKKGEFDYFIFLSGVDYPIQSPAKIHRFFEENQGMNFIDFYQYSGESADNFHFSKVYNEDYVLGSPKIVSLIFRAIFRLARILLPRRTFLKDMNLYRGSTSWCLHKQSVEYIIQFLDSTKSKTIFKFLKYAFSPDEMLFQTILLNSPFAKNCNFYEKNKGSSNNILTVENKAYLHYIDWSPEREDPAILNETDFARIKASKYFFARKFDEKKSARLLDQIDNYLL
ncbi:MAG: beta-1,6-N-acetylglucosaminyltransferase [Candidatus Omnitrophica bacterium]|nr:beta-1,6-N-acetylglucosaminyltransferase [Candidatus Omnitrophota bacterium]